MTSLIKFELGKILRNRTVFGGIVVGCLVLLGIFFVGYHYSQLSMSEVVLLSHHNETIKQDRPSHCL